MKNKFMEEFMEHFKYEGLTFDDVSLVTQYADFLPEKADISSNFTRNVRLNIPFISAAMDTVTESEMAIAMARLGGIGVIHKNLSVTDQAEEARKVKHYLNGLIEEPVVFYPDQTVQEMMEVKSQKRYSFSGFPIVDRDTSRLLGILTSRDIKFLRDKNVPLSSIMSKSLITALREVTLQEAFDIMVKAKVGKLPIVDKDGILKGLYSLHDVKTLIDNIEPDFNRDKNHRLRVAAAVGPYDEERAAALVKVGTDVLVLDTAHGHSKGVVETLKLFKKAYPGTDIIAGNVATAEAAEMLLNAGADAIKVGIGPGSICTTRVVAGVGVPQLTAVYNVSRAVGREIPVIADGGIHQSGDVAKAIAVGASAVMMGSVLAGTQESTGEKMIHHGRKYVIYRGMGSLEAMKNGKASRERYGQSDVDDDKKLVPQGIEGMVPYRGSVEEVITQFAGGVRYSCGYCGTLTVKELQERAKFVRVTNAGLKEAHPHDIIMVKDAPNYLSKD